MTTDVEHHPWQPYVPPHARLLMLGSFPPARHRWCIDFFYPNFTNDMWRIFGICLFGDKERLVDTEHRTYRLNDIQEVLIKWGIALYDTATAVRRTRNTASDKDLEVVETTDLDALLTRMPECCDVVTTGQKATDLFTAHFGIAAPKVGGQTAFTFAGRTVRLHRMPSSSRAYPMKVERKAQYYQPLFDRLTAHTQNDKQ